MSKVKTQPLPQDVYGIDQIENIGQLYQQETGSEAEARFRRIDLAYLAYREELPRGKQGAFERVGMRLALDPEDKKSRIVIGDAVRIFECFRLGGDQGLGYKREELRDIPISRLRAVSQNKKWALAHRSEIAHVLTLPEEGEHGIRAYIEASKPEEERKAPKKPSFESRELRFTAEDADAFDMLLTAIRSKAEAGGQTFSDSAAVARGQLITFALLEWMHVGENIAFLPEVADDQAAD